MYLVLCSISDRSALWAHEQLHNFGINPIQLITTESLSYARWNHRIGAFGNAIHVTLPDGRVIAGKKIKGVLNRITLIGSDQANRAVPGDREYAVSELNAFYLSWLHCLTCRVINRATPQGLCGRWRHPSEWVVLAQRASMPVDLYRQSDRDEPEDVYRSASATSCTPSNKAVVFRGRLFGSTLPSSIAMASARMAQLAGLDLMEIEFRGSAQLGFTFAGASPQPDLFQGGPDLIRAIAESWRAEGDLI
jgi:hypothetical protein